MTPRRQAIKELNEHGYYLERNGSNHDVYRNNELRRSIALKRHAFNENDLRYIRKEIAENSKKEV